MATDRARIADVVRAQTAAVLRIAPAELDETRSLFEQGMNSLVALELAARLGRRLGRTLAPTLVLDHPTMARLVTVLSAESETLTAQAPAAPKEVHNAARHEVAIVGFAAQLPGADTVDAFWKRRLAGDDLVGNPLPARHAPVRRAAAWLGDLVSFDPDRFGLSDHECRQMSALHRIALTTAADAFDHGGLHNVRRRTGVWLGVPDGGQGVDTDAWSGTGSESSFVAGRVSWALDLGGPTLTLNTACSASLVALHAASRAIRNGEVDAALAGGASLLDARSFSILDALGALSADGRSRPFSDSVTGYGRGEGAVVFALVRLDVAQQRGLHVWAILRGSAVGHGGRTPGITVPDAAAQQSVIAQAWVDAGVAAPDIDVIEAHGAGTPLGDPIEVRALAAAFAGAGRLPFLGSAKCATGHLEQAAGAVGVLSAVLMIRDGVVPPHVHGGSAPGFQIADVATVADIRTVAVSAWGLSGVNAHAVVSGPPVRTAFPSRPGPTVALVSAVGADHVSDAAVALADLLKAQPWPDCAAATLRSRPLTHRRAVVATSGEEAAQYLVHGPFIAGRATTGRRVALVFGGAGSQRVGAGATLYDTDPDFRSDIDEAAAAVREEGSLQAALFDPLDARLNGILWTQVGATALNFALAQRWVRQGLPVHAAIGHSFGEIAAAAFVGALPIASAMALALARGRRMASLRPGGAMAVVYASVDETAAMLPADVFVAGVHAPDETVISGPIQAVNTATTDAVKRGFRCKPIAVDNAYHSPLVDPVLDAFASDLKDLRIAPARVPVFGSSGARADLVWGSASYWTAHLRSQVHLMAAVGAAREAGIDTLVECGGNAVVLAAAARHPDPPSLTVATLRKGQDDDLALAQAAAELLVHGVDLPEFMPKANPATVPQPLGRRRDVPFSTGAQVVPPPPQVVAPARYAVGWTESETRSERELGPVTVLTDGGAFGDAVVTKLRASGVVVTQAQSANPGAAFVVDLRGVNLEASPDAWRRWTGAVRDSVNRLGNTPTRVLWVTGGAVAVHPQDAVIPGQSIVWGMARTLSAEAPQLAPGVVDIEPNDVDGLLEAIRNQDAEAQVAIRKGRRWVARLRVANDAVPMPEFRADRAYLIVGGLGELGRHLAASLRRRGAGRVWCLGRRDGVSGPDPEIRCLGGIDASDNTALALAFSQIDAEGPPLAGVFHLAAVLADGLLATQDLGVVDTVLRPKVDVAYNLHLATAKRHLDHFVMYGSAASLMPSVGQAVYAGANAFLDGLAAHRRNQGLPGISIAWGPWADIGLASALGSAHRQRQEGMGLRFHSPAEADAALDLCFGAAEPTVLVAHVDWARWFATQPGSPFEADLRPVAPNVPRKPEGPQQAAGSPTDNLAALVPWLIAAAHDVLGRPASLPIDPDVPLTELGLDSLLAVRLHGRIAESGFVIGVGRVLAGPSVNKLAKELWATRHQDPEPARPADDVPSLRQVAIGSAALGALMATLFAALAWSLVGADSPVVPEVIVLPAPPALGR